MRILLAIAATAFAMPAFAGPASDAVKFFYGSDDFVADKQFRSRFVDPAVSKFEENDAAPEGEIGCIDFALQYDAQDMDEAEVTKTLKLAESVSGNDATVTASFRLFPGDDQSKRSIVWSLKKVGKDWKIADIAQGSGEWRLSEFDCSASDAE
jgi:hypothetical protein